MHDVLALVRLPGLLVELATHAAFFVAARFVQLLLGVGHRRGHARIGEALLRDLGVDPFANTSRCSYVGPSRHLEKAEEESNPLPPSWDTVGSPVCSADGVLPTGSNLGGVVGPAEPVGRTPSALPDHEQPTS